MKLVLRLAENIVSSDSIAQRYKIVWYTFSKTYKIFKVFLAILGRYAWKV